MFRPPSVSSFLDDPCPRGSTCPFAPCPLVHGLPILPYGLPPLDPLKSNYKRVVSSPLLLTIALSPEPVSSLASLRLAMWTPRQFQYMVIHWGRICTESTTTHSCTVSMVEAGPFGPAHPSHGSNANRTSLRRVFHTSCLSRPRMPRNILLSVPFFRALIHIHHCVYQRGERSSKSARHRQPHPCHLHLVQKNP